MLNLYKNIKAAREKQGMSQDELARLVGFKSRSSINKIELGVNDITQSKLLAIARALKTTPAALMGEPPPKTWFVAESSPSYGEPQHLSPKESKLIEEYRKSSDNVRKSIDALLQL